MIYEIIFHSGAAYPISDKNMSPFWWDKKGWFFFTPLPPVWTNVSFSAIFVLDGFPNMNPQTEIEIWI